MSKCRNRIQRAIEIHENEWIGIICTRRIGTTGLTFVWININPAITIGCFYSFHIVFAKWRNRIKHHFLCLFYAIVMVLIGGLIYKKNNHKFLYYM